MKEVKNDDLRKLNIDELTHEFMDNINEQNMILIEGIDYLIEEDFENFHKNLNIVIETRTEVKIKKAFEANIKKIVPNKDNIKKLLLNISVEDKVFEEAYSVQSKNLFNLLITEIKKEELSTIKPVLKAAREFCFRPENKEQEVSLSDLFFSIVKNKNTDKQQA